MMFSESFQRKSFIRRLGSCVVRFIHPSRTRFIILITLLQFFHLSKDNRRHQIIIVRLSSIVCIIHHTRLYPSGTQFTITVEHYSKICNKRGLLAALPNNNKNEYKNKRLWQCIHLYVSK